MKYEQNLKSKFGKGNKNEIALTNKTLVKLIVFSLMGGWISGALGLGGGMIFNPLLMSLGVPPKVATSSGMYMIIFASGATTVSYLFNGLLNIPYSIWLGVFCMIGSCVGMYFMLKLMKYLNRQSPLLLALIFV
jgi:uncharacterized membrane protein YfcA